MPAHRPTRAWRALVASAIALVGLSYSAGVLWDQDMQYALPTPVPPGLESPDLGAPVLRDERVAPLLAHHRGRPLLVHTFGASCPCSWFNAEHVRELLLAFGDRVDFLALVECEDATEGLEAFHEQGLRIPAVVDVGDRIAHALGAYSTPQAVLLDGEGRLFFRGNYNLSRYCIDKRTEFARLAIEDLLAGRTPPQFGAAASIAYGCALPSSSEPATPR